MQLVLSRFRVWQNFPDYSLTGCCFIHITELKCIFTEAGFGRWTCYYNPSFLMVKVFIIRHGLRTYTVERQFCKSIVSVHLELMDVDLECKLYFTLVSLLTANSRQSIVLPEKRCKCWGMRPPTKVPTQVQNRIITQPFRDKPLPRHHLPDWTLVVFM